MKKVKIVLLIISVIIIVSGIMIGLGTSNEILNSISIENNVNGATYKQRNSVLPFSDLL